MAFPFSVGLHPSGIVGFLVGRASCVAIVVAASPLLAANVGRAQQADSVAPPVFYTQGDPTDDEQYLLQLLNRARLDPVGEGQRLAAWLRDTAYGQAVVSDLGVDPDQVASDFAMLPAVPPMAFNADLIAAARSHASDLAAHSGVGAGGDLHAGYDGSQPYDRVKASGYQGAYVSECAFGDATSLDVVHAGYLVDWGNPGLGHRMTCMNGNNAQNEVGIGLASLSSGDLAETEDYGQPILAAVGGKLANADVPAILTGVVYSDDNGNGQYDPGEGIAGVTVTMDGGAYYAVTSASGGYAFLLVNAADGSNADGTVSIRMTFADGGVCMSTVTILPYEGLNGPYRANVEWDATAADDQPPTDPNLSYFGGGKTVTVAAGGMVNFKVFRPADSDLSQPYTVSYKTRGSAVAGINYAVLPAMITVPADERAAKIKIVTLQSSGETNATTLKLRLPGVSYRGAKNVTIIP